MLDLKIKRWYYNKCTKEISENAHKSKKTAKLILYFCTKIDEKIIKK